MMAEIMTGASPRRIVSGLAPRHRRPGAVAWHGASVAAAGIVAASLGAVAVFLVAQGASALGATGQQLPIAAPNLARLAGPLVLGSAWVALLALALATPVAIGVGLFITGYAPRRLAPVLAGLVDLLAGIPSVVYGLWGILVVAPMAAPLGVWCSRHAGWLPFFGGQASATGRTILTVSIVLAIMIMPIMAAVAREIFARTPSGPYEAALALGATKAEAIRTAVLPPARQGLVAAAMLALGRALGETMAVAMVLSANPLNWTWSLITSSGPSTTAAFIAQTFPEANGTQVQALLALGCALFAVTLVINALARRIGSGDRLRTGAR
jgi:phosphate transport system permease protein